MILKKNLKLVILLIGILSISFISSYTQSNFQYTQTGLSSSYLGSQGITLYPQFDEKQCGAGQDFLIQINPLGCSPSVVRSDLLEEQNVPVFCPLSATKLNPMIDVESIDYISFSKKNYSSEYVQGIGFHPAKAAIKSSKTLINSPILENIGYSVIVLKKQKNESSMPDYVEGSLTATLRYNIKNAFGIGSAEMYVPEMSDSQWNENFKKYGFWKGNGYLKADYVTDNEAQISIYRSEENKISTVTLTKGGTSPKIYIPGFYCLATLQLQFVDSEIPDERVKLDVNGNIMELTKGQKFLDNKCNIKDIKKDGCFQKVSIFCNVDDGSSSFELIKSPKIKIKINDDIQEYSIGDNLFDDVYLSSVDSLNSDLECGDDDKFNIQIINSQKKKELIEVNSPKKVFNKDILVMGFAEASNEDFSEKNNFKDFKENFESSMKDYREVIDNFPEEKINEEINTNTIVNTYSEQALIEAIELADKTKNYLKRNELAEELIKKYPNSNYATKVTQFLNNDYENSNSEFSSKDVFINGVINTISFSGIEFPAEKDYSVDVILEGVESNPTIEKLWKNKIVSLSGNYDETIELEKITKDYVSFITKTKDKIKNNYISQRIQVYHTTRLNREDSLGFDKSGNIVTFGENGKYKIKVSNTHVKKYARIKLTPGIENEKTTANFSFKIGIEKRAIKLSPEKTKEKIKKMNETIEKWEKISKNMANVVKGLKAACLGTGAVLTAKNFFENSGGKSEARQAVMRGKEGWFEKCTDLVSERRYPSVDSCLYEKSSEIENDVNKRYNLMQEQNKLLKEIDSKYAENTLGGKVVNDEKFIEDYMPNVAKSLDKFKEISDPTSKSSTPILVSDLKSVLTSDGWKNNYFSKEQARLIELNSKILSDSSSSETLKNIAQKDLYDTLKEVKVTSNNYVERSNIAQQFSLSPNEIAFLEIKKAKKLNYEGTIYSNIKQKIKLDNQDISDTTPVQVIQTSSGEKYIAILDDSSGKGTLPIKRKDDKLLIYDLNGKLVEPIDELNKVYFQKFDRTSYQNKYSNSEASYYETEPYKGMPAIVPFDLTNGWYAATKQTLPIAGNIKAYDESGKVSSYYLCNVGKNEREQFNSGIGDDICEMINLGINQPYNQFSGLTEGESVKLVKAATSAIEQASRQYKTGVTKIKISTSFGSYNIKVGKPATNIPETQCQDFMSPKDCHLLFNVCDPVICPSSRCNLGGNYYVDNVIQSGIVGSAALCLPNVREKIFVPVCLTGIQAGTDSLLSIYKASQKCLQESITTGKNIGICDEIQSIYLCEFFWRESVPIAKLAIPKVLESFTGQGIRGGGEYMGVSSAWESAQNSVNYFTQYYGANSYKAFKARSTDEVGSAICKNFVSAVYPSGGNFFESLVEPDSPTQYNAWFSEIPYTSSTSPATSQYKVYYHIYAGKDIGAYYRIYLRNPSGSSFYQVNPTVVVANGFIGRGEYEDQTKDFLAPSGYQELCITINSKEECGFKQVSTSFALDYIKESYLKEQASKTNIKTEAECISGSPSIYSLVNPNLEEGVDDVINPDLYNSGITRICSTDDPGKGTDFRSGTNLSRWKQVGYCDSNKKIKCWLDSNSVKENINIKYIQNEVLNQTNAEYMKILQEGGYLDENKFKDIVIKIKNEKNSKEKIKLIENNLDKVFFSKQKAQLILLKGGAYSNLAINEFNKMMSIEVKSKKEEDKSKNFSTNTTPQKKYTLDSAIEKVKKLSGKYSSNEENKQFIDQIKSDDIITEEEYSEIIGKGLWDLEADMNYVKKILLLKKK